MTTADTTILMPPATPETERRRRRRPGSRCPGSPASCCSRRRRPSPSRRPARAWCPTSCAPASALLRGATVTRPSSTVVSTLSVIGSFSSPSLPLAVSLPPAIATCTPAGISTGYLPTRDMCPLLRTRGRGLRRRHWQRGPRHRSTRLAAWTGWKCPGRHRPAAAP